MLIHILRVPDVLEIVRDLVASVGGHFEEFVVLWWLKRDRAPYLPCRMLKSKRCPIALDM